MFQIAKEIVDRFIKWHLSKAKGSDLTEKLMNVVRTLSLLFSISVWLIVALIIIDINLRIRITDTEEAATAITRLFDKNNPLAGFINLDKKLSSQLMSLQDTNKLLVQDNSHLIQDNQSLESQNELLKKEVESLKEHRHH